MRIAFSIWLVLSCLVIQAQYISEWHTLTGNSGISLNSIKQSNSNIAVWFYSKSDSVIWDENTYWYKSEISQGNHNSYFTVFDSLQNALINIQFFSKKNYTTYTRDMEITNDQNYILSFISSDSLWMNDSLIYVDDSSQLNRHAFHVMKIKPDGSVAFHTKFVGGFVLDAYLGLLPDGKIVVAGTVDWRDITIGEYELPCTGCHVEDSDVFVAVLDSNGDVLNAKRFGGGGYDYCEDLLCTSVGGIYLTGSFFSSDFYVDSLSLHNYLAWFISDAFVVKLDSNLNLQWMKSARSTNDEYGFCLEEDKSGNIYWGVHFGGSKVYFDGDTIWGGANNSFLCKMDGDGGVDWAKTFTSSYFNRFLDISVDDADNVWLSIWYNDTLTFAGGTLEGAGNGKQDAALVQLDSEGNYLQSFNITEPSSEIVYQVEPMPGNRLFVVGNADSLNFLNMSIQREEGFGDPYFYFILDLPIVATEEPRKTSAVLDISVYPSPTSDWLNIQIGACHEDFNGRISVYDTYGRLRIQRNLNVLCEGANAVFEVSHLPSGAYYLRLDDANGGQKGSVRFCKM